MTTETAAKTAAGRGNDPAAVWLFSLGPSFFMGSGFFCLARAAGAAMFSAPQFFWFVGAVVLLRFWRMSDKTEQLTRNLRQLEAAILTHEVIAENQRLARVPGARLSVKRRRPQIEYTILAE